MFIGVEVDEPTASDSSLGYPFRRVGGPKLMRRVSPRKTWSGALSGTGAAIVSALAVAYAGGLTGTFPLAVLACALSVSAQAGDLLESALKRKFGAKDASQLIPGHGGLMDRLDGFAAASFLAALIGVVGHRRRPDLDDDDHSYSKVMPPMCTVSPGRAPALASARSTPSRRRRPWT